MRKLYILLLLALLAACGGDSVVGSGDAGDSSSPPDKSNFVATSVTEGGVERPLVDGTQIEIHFDGGRIGASAGCNLISGNFSVNGQGVLTVTDVIMTERGCDAPRHAQDEFVASFLASGPTFTVVSDDAIRLSTSDVVMAFVDEAVANPPLPLLGTEWEVDGFFDASVANSFNVDTPALIQFLDESTAVGFDGCTEFTIDIEVDDAAQSSGTLRFGGILDDAPADCVDVAYAYRVSTSIRGEASYVIDADRLTLTASNGVGIDFRAR